MLCVSHSSNFFSVQNWVRKSYKVNDRCRAGVFDLISAGVLIHTARASSATTPNTAILGVSSATSAAVWPPHWTIEQSHWNEEETGQSVRILHYFYIKYIHNMYPLQRVNTWMWFLTHRDTHKKDIHTINSPHHTDPQRCRWGSCFFSSRWWWLGIPPSRQNRHTETQPYTV